MTLNDLECPIYFKVRLVDVRLLRVSDSTIRIDVAKGQRERRGSGLEGLAPFMWVADALFLCGS